MRHSKMNLFLILFAMLTTQTAIAAEPDRLLMPGQAAPYMGVLSPRETYESYVGSKKKLPICHEALDTCNKSLKFPEIVGPVRDGFILGSGVTIIVLTIAYALGSH